MRIFYASDNTPNASLKSNLWRNNLYLPLIDLGHDVVEFKYDLRKTFQNLNKEDSVVSLFIKKNRPKVTKELLYQLKLAHKKKPVDLFFCYLYDACILPEAIDEIKAMGIKTVNWYCNGSYQLHLVSEISPHYNWCLVPEKFRLNDYIMMGANPIYCQEAANPKIYKPYNVPIEYEVSFVGQAYGDRPIYVKYLLNKSIDIKVWGLRWDTYSTEYQEKLLYRISNVKNRFSNMLTLDGWNIALNRLRNVIGKKNSIQINYNSSEKGSTVDLPAEIIGGLLSDEEMIRLYSKTKINIGFSSCGNTHNTTNRILQVRLRDFEVPMSGGFYMVEYMEELEEFFNIGKEIVCYNDKEDLSDKIKYYLSHESERESIRKAGYERCLRDHTWHKRFQMVFKEMGLE